MRSATTEHLLARLRDALATSALLRAVASVRRDGGRGLALEDTPLRPLSLEEVARLEKQGSSAGDWARVLVAEGFDPSRVRNVEFQGDVILGRFAGSVGLGGRQLPTGVFNSTLIDSVVGHEALVRDVRLLAGYVVGPGAILFDCGRVVCDSATTFGNGTVLSLGIESGGRPVPVYAEVDVEMADAVARPCGRRRWLDLYKTAVEEYAARATSERGIIEAGARVQNTPRVQNSATSVNPLRRTFN